MNDSIDAFQKNPYGQKSLDITNSAYESAVKPLLPYAQGPYSYVAPYVQKADEMGDDMLTHGEKYFPVLKEDSEKVKDSAMRLIFWPFYLAAHTRDYAFDTWNDEYKKTEGEGIPKLVKAAISTDLKFMSDAYNMAMSILQQGKERGQDNYQQAQKKGHELYDEAQKRLTGAKETAEKKGEEYMQTAQQKGEETKQTAQKKADEAKKNSQ